MQRTIFVRGAFGRANFGDDALMYAVSHIAKTVFPADSVFFVCPEADYVKGLIAEACVICLENRDLQAPDVVLYGGGTQFYSFPLTSATTLRSWLAKGAHVAANPVRLREWFRRKRRQQLCRVSNVKVAAIGIGVGPFVRSCRIMKSTRSLFMRMDYVAVRDKESYRLLKDWGCSPLFLGADLCYLPGLWDKHLQRFPIRRGHGIKRLCIIVRDWPHSAEGDSYAKPLYEVVDKLRSDRVTVDWLSLQCSGDQLWTRRLAERGELTKRWDPSTGSFSPFLEVLASYDAFITARFHGAVFASILGKPAICIGVEQKLAFVASLLGKGACLWPYPFVASQCIGYVRTLNRTYSDAVEHLAAVAESQGRLVQAVINGCSTHLGSA